jgi:hypothetical protein
MFPLLLCYCKLFELLGSHCQIGLDHRSLLLPLIIRTSLLKGPSLRPAILTDSVLLYEQPFYRPDPAIVENMEVIYLACAKCTIHDGRIHSNHRSIKQEQQMIIPPLTPQNRALEPNFSAC